MLQQYRQLACTKVKTGSRNSAASKFILHYITHAAVCGWIPDKRLQFIHFSTICTPAEDLLTRLEHSQYVVKLNVPQRVSSRRALGASRPRCTKFPLQRGSFHSSPTHFSHYTHSFVVQSLQLGVLHRTA